MVVDTHVKRTHPIKHTPLGHTLSLIELPSSSIRFLILDCPTESTLPLYLEEFKHLDVSTVVRCCQPTYNSQILLQNGIDVVDLPFKDGGVVSHNHFFFKKKHVLKFILAPSAYCTSMVTCHRSSAMQTTGYSSCSLCSWIRKSSRLSGHCINSAWNGTLGCH